MPIQRPADAGPVAAHEFRGFNGLIGHAVVAWRPGFVEMTLKVRPELCNANGLLHGGVLMTLLDSASGFACTFNETATARRLSVTLAFTQQFVKAARDGDRATDLPLPRGRAQRWGPHIPGSEGSGLVPALSALFGSPSVWASAGLTS